MQARHETPAEFQACASHAQMNLETSGFITLADRACKQVDRAARDYGAQEPGKSKHVDVSIDWGSLQG